MSAGINKPDVVIGMSFGYHDSACCILVNGELRAAAQEERFSRIKNDKSVPVEAFRFCLEFADINIDEVDCIAYYEEPSLKLSRQLWMSDQDGASDSVKDKVLKNLIADTPEEIIRKTFGFDGEIHITEHHLSHAASSYFFSGFDDSAILTVDGVGEWATTTYGKASGIDIELFEEVSFPNSLGLFYGAITSYLGFKVNSGEYKVMGLAPYGEPVYVDKFKTLIKSSEGGQFELNQEYFDFFQMTRMYTDKLIQHFGQPARKPESDIDKFHLDMAKSLQVVLEGVLLDKVNYLYSRVPSKNLCMAGGVALNCVANGRILREGPYENLFVQPASGDSGTALGAAALAYISRHKYWPAANKMEHAYLGPEYSNKEILRILKQSSISYSDYCLNEEGMLKSVAEKLAEGKVIGWFQGRMEFGPRALGARSILADARSPNMRDKINSLVKKRESFRPFAPAVLNSDASEHFVLDCASPFMLNTCQVRSRLDLPAITHVDNSARVQTVHDETNIKFAKLLRKFKEVTGCPMLLNTSFNVRSEPMICSITDAIECFVRAELDMLVLGDFVLEKDNIPSLWKIAVKSKPLKGDGNIDSVGHLVYTFL